MRFMALPKLRKLLCPTDFSLLSDRALGYATGLGRLYGAEVEALHVFPVVYRMPGDVTYVEALVRLDEDTRRTLFERLGRFLEPTKGSGVETRALLGEGDPATVILERALHNPIDLIVMGTHGLRGFDRWIMGSVAQRVLRKTACPVLTVPPASAASAGDGPPVLKTILCALDLSAHSEATLEYAVSLARAANATLVTLHVRESEHIHDEAPHAKDDSPFLLELHQHVEALSRGVVGSLPPGEYGDVRGIVRLVVRGRAHDEILKVASERRADMIVMGVQRPRGAPLPFFGSTVRHVLERAECPVLTVRPRQDTPALGTAAEYVGARA
jgi:nucleotide-binding universal stress UspA family protein